MGRPRPGVGGSYWHSLEPVPALGPAKENNHALGSLDGYTVRGCWELKRKFRFRADKGNSYGRGNSVKITLFLLLLLFSTLAHAATFNRSTGAGLASASGNWSTGTSPCGSGGDNVFVAVQTRIVLDCSLGTSGTGINKLSIEAGGSLCSYDGTHTTCGNKSTQGAQTIYFNSTGTNPIGSGSIYNPGSDATAFGVYMAYGTFYYQGDASNHLILTAANATSPIYVVHEWDSYNGGTGIGTTGETGGARQGTHGAVFTCYYCKLVNVGSSSFPQYMEGLAYSLKAADATPASALDIEYAEFDAPYEITNGNVALTSNANWTMKNVWLNGPTSAYALAIGATAMGLTLANITETGATTTGYLIHFTAYPSSLTFQGNVVVGNSAGTVQRGLVSQGATMSGTYQINNNACFNAEGTTSTNCLDLKFKINDTTSTFSGNVCWGAANCFHFLSPSGSTSGPIISNNWGAVYKEAYASQGVFESAGYYFHLSNNIAINENDDGTHGTVGTLVYLSPSVYQIDNMTIYTTGTGANDNGLSVGDGSGAGSVVASPSYVRSTIIFGYATGYSNNTGNNYSTAGTYSMGLSNNLVYGATSGKDYCGAGLTCASHGTGSGYDDGSHYHPNATYYGDLADATNPNFRDPTRRPAGYSTVCVGAGTIADLGTQYSYRDGLGVPYDSCYDISRMLLWLQVGFMPLNQQLRHAGFGGTYVGAIPLLCGRVAC